MVITEINEEGQLDKPHLTESYSQTFWHHAKQIAKGALVLGGGLLAYTAWRNFGAQSSSTTDNIIAKVSMDITSFQDDILQVPLVDFIDDENYSNSTDLKFSPMSHNKRRAGTTQCIPYWQEFPSQAQIAGAVFSNGNYVMAWTGNDGYIYAQLYAPDGSELGNELSVSINQVNINYGPVVAVLTNDNFVIVWSTASITVANAYQIYGQIYDSFANQLTSLFDIGATEFAYPSTDFPSIAALSDGSFIIAITINNQPNIFRYSSSGAILGQYSTVSSILSGTVRTYPVITGLTNGSFAGAWLVPYMGTQAYLGSGGYIEEQVVVTSNISYPVIAGLPNGNYVIAWTNDQSTYAQLFSQTLSGGYLSPETLGSNFQVNTSPGGKSQPGITSLSNGEFIIAWQSQNNVYMQRYTVSSTNSSVRLGPELFLSDTPAANMGVTPYTPMFALPNGEFFVMWQNWAQRVYGNLTIANTCDQSYTENVPLQLGLAVSPLFYAFNQTTISVQLLNTIAGQLKSLLTTSGTATANYNATSGVWLETGANVADLNALLSTLQFVPALNYNANATISVNAQDDLGNTFQSDFTLKGIPVDYPPSWVNNQMVINQGQTLTLSRSNLQVYDLGKTDNIIQINVISAQNGQFEFISQPGTPITTFTQQNVDNAQVAFVHNGLSFAPTYALTAADGIFTTPVSIGIVNFDLQPEILINTLAINQRGQNILLGPSQILATDSDDLPNQLIFTVSNLQHGHFELKAAPGKSITTFSQLYIDSGLVKFIHDGSYNAPSYTLTVNDGRMTSESSNAAVSFNVQAALPFTETTGFKAGVSLATTAVGTLVGLAAWRYRNHKDAERRRQKSIIANIIRDDLNLSGVADFESENGVQLIEAIHAVSKKLERNHNIDVEDMMKFDQEKFAHALALCFKPYVSNKVPEDNLKGSNKISQAYLSCYYLKVKPILKSNACWLNTDAVKQAASTIAGQVKQELDNPTSKSSAKVGGGVEMQTLRN